MRVLSNAVKLTKVSDVLQLWSQKDLVFGSEKNYI